MCRKLNTPNIRLIPEITIPTYVFNTNITVHRTKRITIEFIIEHLKSWQLT